MSSYSHVAAVAPTTSGSLRKELKVSPVVPSSCRYRFWASRAEMVMALTPKSSWAVPVSVKVNVGTTVPMGPVMKVSGV